MPKSKKSAGAPKRPASAYLLFSAEVREATKAEAPEASFADLNRAIGAKWGALSDDEKARYTAAAEEAKSQYQVAHAEWLASRDPDESDDEPSGKKKKRVKDPNAPKKPLSSYMIFAGRIRSQIQEENPDASFTDIGRLIGKKWRDMTDEEKKPFEEDAALQKEKYAIAMEEYNGGS